MDVPAMYRSKLICNRQGMIIHDCFMYRLSTQLKIVAEKNNYENSKSRFSRKSRIFAKTIGNSMKINAKSMKSNEKSMKYHHQFGTTRKTNKSQGNINVFARRAITNLRPSHRNRMKQPLKYVNTRTSFKPACEGGLRQPRAPPVSEANIYINITVVVDRVIIHLRPSHRNRMGSR